MQRLREEEEWTENHWDWSGECEDGLVGRSWAMQLEAVISNLDVN